MAYFLVALSQLLGLALIPFGLPGLWVQVGGLALYAWLTGFATIGWVPIVIATGLAAAAEVADLLLGGRFARRYGGGRRAAWGAIIGGIIGAVAGLPLPVLGSVAGAFAGSFAGAAALELTTRRGTLPALRAGWGALLGRLAATVFKAGVGVSVALLVLVAAVR